MSSRQEVENPMVTGAGRREPEPEAVCPHCGDGWFPGPDSGFWDGSLWAPWPLTFSGRYCLACVASACGTDQALRDWYAQEGEDADLFRFFLGDQPQITLEGLAEEARLVIGLLRRHEAELYGELLREYAQAAGPSRRNSWISYLWAVC